MNPTVRVIQVHLENIGAMVDTPVSKEVWDVIPVQFKGAAANKLANELAVIEKSFMNIPKVRWKTQANQVGLSLAIRGVQRIWLEDLRRAVDGQGATRGIATA